MILSNQRAENVSMSTANHWCTYDTFLAHAYAYAYAFKGFEHRPLSLLYVPPVLQDLRRTVAHSVTVSGVPVEVADRKGGHHQVRFRAWPGCNPAGHHIAGIAAGAQSP